MSIPKENEELTLATDASGSGIGWTLTITKTGNIVELGGRQFKEQEHRYTTMEVELMAAAEALSKLRLYIARCSKITLLTDNKCALGHINSSRLPTTDRAMKFLFQIQNTKNLTAKYISTKDNGMADGLSRDLLQPNNELPQMMIQIEDDRRTMEKLILHVHEMQHRIDINDINVVTRSMKKKLENSKINTEIQTEVDEELLTSLIKETHNQFMHVGQQRLKLLLNLLFPTRQFNNDIINKVCKQCKKCVERKKLAAACAVGKMYIPSRPTEVIHIDHFTLYSNVLSLHNKSTLLTIKDSFTKFVTLVPCKGYGHQEIIDALRLYLQ